MVASPEEAPRESAPSQRELCLLFDMLHRVFLETRLLGHNGKAEQAAHLASAFHRLPQQVEGCCCREAPFDWADLRQQLEWYQELNPREAESFYDYVAMLNLVDVPRR